MKKRQSQSELIKQMTGEDVRKSVVLSQSLFIVIAFGLSVFIFRDLRRWFDLFEINMNQIIIYGLIPALILVFIEIVLSKVVSKEALDDGGINEKVFKNASVPVIFFLSLFISISEELLFRGVIQTTFGFVFASILFALIHVRYLKKPILFVFIILTSFLLGYLYEITSNLLVVMMFHFTVDFLLGLFIKYRSEEE